MRDVANPEVRDVEVGGVTEMGTFSIDATGTAFKTLVGNIYADKFRAICRELCANALDSHVAAGKPKRPFKVTLPTRTELTFSVRDYGVSLSHQDVMGLYTTLFRSTKKDTNTQVGKFGLGSKVPFAYSDSFSVTAIKDGERRIYNAFIDEKGIPRIALLLQEPCEEEQGLEVGFPVEQRHIDTFKDALKFILPGFDVMPECNVPLPKIEKPTMAGDGWKLYEGHRNSNEKVWLRQGCVLYPVSLDSLKAEIKNPKDPKYQNTMELFGYYFDGQIVIDAPIGTFDITPSRESISYDNKSSENIFALLNTVTDQLVADIVANIQKQSSFWHACKAYNSVMSKSHYLKAILSHKDVRWNGRRVRSRNLYPRQLYALQLFSMEKSSRAQRKGYVTSTSTGRSLWNSDKGQHSTTLKYYYYPPGKKPSDLEARMFSVIADAKENTCITVIRDFNPASMIGKMLAVMWNRPPHFADIFKDINEVEPDTADIFKKLSTAPLRIWSDLSKKFELPNAKQPDYKIPEAGEDEVYYISTYSNNPFVSITWDMDAYRERDCDVKIERLIECGLINPKWKIVGVPATWRQKGGVLPPNWTSISDLVNTYDWKSIFEDIESCSWHGLKYSTITVSHHRDVRYVKASQLIHEVATRMKTKFQESPWHRAHESFHKPKKYDAWLQKFETVCAILGINHNILNIFDNISRFGVENKDFTTALNAKRYTMVHQLNQIMRDYPMLEPIIADDDRHKGFSFEYNRKTYVATLAEYVDMVDTARDKKQASVYAWG